ncbi:MAG: RNA methyltransferase [Deltaproteobacteria bacterium]|nr:RNA methyltransferase [Candidatus Anaeroferrophillacea bacterium]
MIEPRPLDNIAVVLVEPKLDENVGAVARAMKNFAVNRLLLVAPRCDHLTERARRRSCSAEDILESAVCYDTLAEALTLFTFIVGTTSRQGKYVSPVFSPAEIAGKVHERGPEEPVALLFGREDFGLDREARRACHVLSSVPVNPACGSINLSQSVLLYGYELFRTANPPPRARPAGPAADQRELEGMYGHMQETLTAAGFFDGDNAVHLMEYVRRLFGRAGMSRREVRIVRGIIRLIDNLSGFRK